jgi:hypothetical protein
MTVPECCLTVQIIALLPPKYCTHFLHPAGQRHLDVLRHDLVPLLQVPSLSGVPDHNLDAFDSLLAALKGTGDFGCEFLNLPLLLLLDGLVVEPREDVLRVQLVQLGRLEGDFFQHVVDLVLDVDPARRQQVHLDHGISIVFIRTRGHEPPRLFRP